LSHNPAALIRQYAAVRDTKPLLQYVCGDCSRWIIRVFQSSDPLVVVREPAAMFDHEMTAETARDDARAGLAALDVVGEHPRPAEEPFITTFSSLVRHAGRGQDLTAFCCAEHGVAIDEVLGNLAKRVESRVSRPDRSGHAR